MQSSAYIYIYILYTTERVVSQLTCSNSRFAIQGAEGFVKHIIQQHLLSAVDLCQAPDDAGGARGSVVWAGNGLFAGVILFSHVAILL